MKASLLTILVNFLFCALALAQGHVNPHSHYVSPYVRSDGTYVQGYHRTNRNNTNRDNYSTLGNTNPWTGQSGWIIPDNKPLPSSTVTSYQQSTENARYNNINVTTPNSYYTNIPTYSAPEYPISPTTGNNSPSTGYSSYSYELSAGPRVINYSNGREEFNVVEPSIILKKGLTYYSYDVYNREIKESVGRTDGQMLLNGNYKFYNESGVLKVFETYKNGLKHGMALRYDDNGRVLDRKDYNEGAEIYHKFINEDGTAFELDGEIGKAGSVILLSNRDGIYKKIEFLGNGRDKRYEYIPGTQNIVATYGMLNQKLDGQFRKLQPDGKTLIAISNYKNDKLEGTLLSYDEKGVLRSKVNYKDDVQDGPFEIFNEAKVLTQKGIALNGKLHGQLLTYNDDGKLRFQETYIYGILNGSAKWFWDNKVVIDGTYLAGEKNGKWNYYWLDSNQYFIAQYFNYKNGTLDGAFQEIKGDSVLIGTYRNGLLEGKIQIHQPISLWLIGVPPQKIGTDDLLYDGQYSNGKKTGRWKCYDRTQTLVEEGDYMKDLKQGEWRYYLERYIYENGTPTSYSGKLFLIENYLSGLKNGRSERFGYLTKVPVPCDTINDTSNPFDTCYRIEYLKVNELNYYKNNLLHGPLEWRDEAGSLTRKGEYYMGKMSGAWTVISEDPQQPGNKFRFEVNYDNDLLNGSFQKYDASSNFLLEEGQYNQNQKNELWNEYYPDGKNQITTQTHFVQGKYNFAKNFYKNGNLKLYSNYINGDMSLLEGYDTINNKVILRFANIHFEGGNYDFNLESILGDTTIRSHIIFEIGLNKPEIDPLFFYSTFMFISQYSPSQIYSNGHYSLKGKNGVLIEEGFFLKNQLDGTWKYYFQDQKLIRHIQYEAGIKKSERYTKLGSSEPFSGKFILHPEKIKGYLSIKVKNGLRNGFTLQYDPQGVLIKKVKYKDGKMVVAKPGAETH